MLQKTGPSAFFRHQAACQTAVQVTKASMRIIISSDGVGFFSDTETEHILIRLADEALYRAKTLGRNRVEIAK